MLLLFLLPFLEELGSLFLLDCETCLLILLLVFVWSLVSARAFVSEFARRSFLVDYWLLILAEEACSVPLLSEKVYSPAKYGCLLIETIV